VSEIDFIKELEFWRCDRPSEYKMDEFIRSAKKLEKENAELRESLKETQRMLNDYQQKWKSQ
tara:strand:- start:967 stop:1152 length:186 start_codon:yes stop_codon:yes gene_type:complete